MVILERERTVVNVRENRRPIWILGILSLCVVALVAFLLYSGVLVVDYSARRGAEETVFWQGHQYVHCGGRYHEGKTIAKTIDGWDINEVEEDPSHTFIVFRSFLDQYVLVREDFSIPSSGRVTVAVWNGDRITDSAFCDAAADLVSSAKPDFAYQTDAIFQLTEKQRMRPLYFGYEGCPVATEFVGYMGTVDGRWVITTAIPIDRFDTDGSPKPYTVQCYTIPAEYHDILRPYFS